MTSQIKHVFNLWLLHEHIPLFHNTTMRGKYSLDGYDIMAFN